MAKRLQAVRIISAVYAGATLLLCASHAALAAPGDWPEPRQNPRLTAIQPLPGTMTEAPALLARFDLGRSRPAVTPVAMADGDHAGLAVVAGALHCYDTNGTLRWHSHPPGLNFERIVKAEDLDGDGSIEVLLTAGRPVQPFGAAVLLALDDGRLLWRYDVDPMSYAWYCYANRYCPGASSQQIVVMMQGYPPDKDNGYITLFSFAEAGEAPQQQWRYDFDQYTCFPSLLQSDLDNDGIQEFAVETHSRMWFLDVQTGALKHFVQWEVSPGNVRSYGYIKFVDLNGDRREDFLCIADFAQHHEVLLNQGGALEEAWHYGWDESVTTGRVATTWPEPPYADIDGDGALEIVVSMFNAEGEGAWLVRVYDAVSGTLEQRYPGLVAARCVDLDGDGSAEILGNRSADPTQTALDGACVLKARDTGLEAIWQDQQATVLGGKDQGARVRVASKTHALTFDNGKPSLTAWQPPPAPPGPDFSPLPEVVGAPAPALLAADLTDDGANNLLLFREPDLRVLRFQRGQPCALHEIGNYRSTSLPVPADLDGDGALELVLSTVTPTAPPVIEAITPAQDDKQLWRYTFPAPEGDGLPQPRTAYVRILHLTGKPTPDLYVWAGTPVVRSAGLDGRTGALLWDKRKTPNIERYWGPSVNFASAWDFNNDGSEDLVFTNPDYYCIADGTSGEPLLGPLFPPKIFDQPSQGLYTCPVILEEKDRPPTVCLVAGHYFQGVMSLDGTPRWYAVPVPGANRSGQEAFLRLPDGTWLMGYGRQNGNFTCINVADGGVRWELPVEAACSDAIAGDVDGDGRFEFVFGTSHGRIYAVGDDKGNPRILWQASTDAPASAPILADLDADQQVELVCVTADGYVNIFGRPHS